MLRQYLLILMSTYNTGYELFSCCVWCLVKFVMPRPYLLILMSKFNTGYEWFSC